MNVVYVLQSGGEGPVTLGTCADRALRRRLAALQLGNPELLHLRALLDGDERLERRLHARLGGHRLRGDWYAPEALAEIPPETPRVPFDAGGEARRLAAMTLAELAQRR